MSKKSYFEKLKDPKWQKRRLEIMERDNFTCRTCRSTEDTLNVHHTHYRKGADPWDYDDDHLLTLCERCHGLAEARRESILKATADPIIQVQIMHFASALAGDWSPFSGWFQGALNALHVMMLEEESVKDWAMEHLDNSGPSDLIGKHIGDFDKALVELQEHIFRIRQNLQEIESSALAGHRHPIIEALFPAKA